MVEEEDRVAKSWKGNIKDWTGRSLFSLLRVVDDIRRWATINAEVSVEVLDDARTSRDCNNTLLFAGEHLHSGFVVFRLFIAPL